MTRQTNAKLAGITFLIYIVIGLGNMFLINMSPPSNAGVHPFANLSGVSSSIKVAIVLSLLTCFTAFILASSLYAITKDEDPDLARLMFSCRVAEGVLNVFLVIISMALLWLKSDEGFIDPEVNAAFAILLRRFRGWDTTISALFFSVGSAIFSFLLIRGRLVPRKLAYLGIIASSLLALGLPLYLVGLSIGAYDPLFWLPMAVFEITLSIWLICKGVPMHLADNAV